MLQLTSVSYQKKNTALVKDISGTVHAGDRLTLFGPNGAGKSTLMRLMAGIIQQTTWKINASDGLREKNAVGYIPQQLALFENLTVKEHIKFYSKMTGNQSIEFLQEMIENLRLDEMWKKRIHELSGGMKRKVNLAVGLIQQPRIVFLDEPFVGVDLAAKHDMLAWLNRLNERGVTLIFVTHDWQVIHELADRMWMMEQGELLTETTVTDVIEGTQSMDGLASPALQKMISYHS